MLKHARSGPVHVAIAKAEMMPFAPDVFGMVFSKDVVHHLQDTSAYFSESFRLLVEGGLVCTATDSADHIRRRRPLSVYWPGTIQVDLSRYPDIRVLRQQMERAGFTDIRVTEKEMEFDLADLKPYRERSFSCLHLISDEEFDAGLGALERDVRKGSVKGLTLYTFLWGRKP
jgi:SAM-dependent methyltransferase